MKLTEDEKWRMVEKVLPILEMSAKNVIKKRPISNYNWEEISSELKYFVYLATNDFDPKESKWESFLENTIIPHAISDIKKRFETLKNNKGIEPLHLNQPLNKDTSPTLEEMIEDKRGADQGVVFPATTTNVYFKPLNETQTDIVIPRIEGFKDKEARTETNRRLAIRYGNTAYLSDYAYRKEITKIRDIWDKILKQKR